MDFKFKVGITQRVDTIDSRGESRDALDQQLINWVLQSGFVPVPIPNGLFNVSSPIENQPVIDKWLNVVKLDAVILSGGNNIGNIQQRDLLERFLLLWAEDNKKPVLGICRGMQMIGFFSGVKLIKVDEHVDTFHWLKVDSNYTNLIPRIVNSYHNFSLKNCPMNFEILAKSEDGFIEAIRHKELPWEGWMWHPEREKVFVKYDQERFKALVYNGK